MDLANMTVVEFLKWVASFTGITAAFMVSLDLGRRLTGIAFVVFTVSSIAWITAAYILGDTPLVTQNTVLFGINLLGVYRYLWRKQPVR